MNQSTFLEPDVVKGATISECGRYRFTLFRRWGEGPSVLWVMLNPSRADANIDDPTVRRCIAFARAWGFGSLCVVNLYAYRTTDPKELWVLTGDERMGPIENGETVNDFAIKRLAQTADTIVCAWGSHGVKNGRGIAVRKMLAGYDLYALGRTADGELSHPLYLPATRELTLVETAQ